MITKIGRYLTVDEKGCLIPDVSVKKIQPHWQEMIRVVTDFAENNDAILSIYIRGSVPRGLAVDGISDLDLVLLIKEGAANPDVAKLNRELLLKFPFCTGIEWNMQRPAALEKKEKPWFISAELKIPDLLKTRQTSQMPS